MFDSLSDKLQAALDGLKRQGKLTERDVERAAREIRLALLEADVNFKVVKQFVDAVKLRALGTEVLNSLTPAQQFIKIVNEDLAPSADADHDGRSAGLGKDDRLRKACQLPSGSGQEPRIGGWRRISAGRY
jgi:signal recognition particle GTPase